MKVSKKQLRQIIKEEKVKMLREQPGHPDAAGHTIFNSDAMYDLLSNEIRHYLDHYAGGRGEVLGVLSPEETARFEVAVTEATRMAVAEFKS